MKMLLVKEVNKEPKVVKTIKMKEQFSARLMLFTVL